MLEEQLQLRLSTTDIKKPLASLAVGSQRNESKMCHNDQSGAAAAI